MIGMINVLINHYSLWLMQEEGISGPKQQSFNLP